MAAAFGLPLASGQEPARRANWLTFLRNQEDALAAMDFFVVPTVRFQLVYVWFVLDHDRRRLIHFGITMSSEDTQRGLEVEVVRVEVARTFASCSRGSRSGWWPLA